MSKKTYSAQEILRLGLIKRPDGQPYKDPKNIRNLIRKCGFEKNGVLANGKKVFALTQEDIDTINQANQSKP